MPPEDRRDDMQKEALHNLSRIIQDKDLEIEALKQKNTSLLEVLQSEAPSNSSQISGVLSESEKLQKENTVLKEERGSTGGEHSPKTPRKPGLL